MINNKACENLFSLVKWLVDNDHLCGFNMAVVTPDEEYVRSYGYRQLVPEKLPADRNTLYDLASLSKVTSTTSCILKLIENGELT